MLATLDARGSDDSTSLFDNNQQIDDTPALGRSGEAQAVANIDIAAKPLAFETIADVRKEVMARLTAFEAFARSEWIRQQMLDEENMALLPRLMSLPSATGPSPKEEANEESGTGGHSIVRILRDDGSRPGSSLQTEEARNPPQQQMRQSDHFFGQAGKNDPAKTNDALSPATITLFMPIVCNCSSYAEAVSLCNPASPVPACSGGSNAQLPEETKGIDNSDSATTEGYSSGNVASNADLVVRGSKRRSTTNKNKKKRDNSTNFSNSVNPLLTPTTTPKAKSRATRSASKAELVPNSINFSYMPAIESDICNSIIKDLFMRSPNTLV
eukprot:GILJ01019198.1.p1 GENE.GILJ01019198.1~~GILJ01019198.1.p1  ORF type:complete len:359 (-),score=38.71 GILJ01019198.1:523-1503(-)